MNLTSPEQILQHPPYPLQFLLDAARLVPAWAQTPDRGARQVAKCEAVEISARARDSASGQRRLVARQPFLEHVSSHRRFLDLLTRRSAHHDRIHHRGGCPVNVE